jgi:hypothetical protein
MTNNRTQKRFDIRLSAAVTTSERTFTGTTRNLSAGGCCVEGPYPLAEDSEVRLDLFVVVDGIEDERMPPLSTRGSVQWVAETDDGSHAAGIKFDGMTGAQVQWLEAFLGKIDHA